MSHSAERSGGFIPDRHRRPASSTPGGGADEPRVFPLRCRAVYHRRFSFGFLGAGFAAPGCLCGAVFVRVALGVFFDVRGCPDAEIVLQRVRGGLRPECPPSPGVACPSWPVSTRILVRLLRRLPRCVRGRWRIAMRRLGCCGGCRGRGRWRSVGLRGGRWIGCWIGGLCWFGGD
jgi:hypothetical protein